MEIDMPEKSDYSLLSDAILNRENALPKSANEISNEDKETATLLVEKIKLNDLMYKVNKKTSDLLPLTKAQIEIIIKALEIFASKAN